MLAIPISSDSHLIPPIKDFPCPPSFCRTFREGFGQVSTNLDKFNHPSPNNLGIHNEVIPNKVFNLGYMPLFLVEHLIVTHNSSRPRRNAMKEVPNLNFLNQVLRVHFP